MWVWMDRLGTVLFDAAFAAAVFLTFIVLAMLACRQPARRILLARVALLASLAIIPLVAWGHLPRLYVISSFVESRFFPRALFLAAAALEPSWAESGASDDGSPGPGRYVSTSLLERAVAFRNWLPRGLTVLDLACMAAGTGWMALGIAGVQWLIGRSHPPSPATRALFDQLIADRPGPPARTALRVCPRLRRPVVTGLFRPTILIPEALDQAGEAPEPLRLSLLHELAHAARSDHVFTAAAGMAQAVWFFLPHAWWIRSQLLIDQEFLADREAAERYGTSSAYASSLLSLAAPEATGPDDAATEARDRRTPPAEGPRGVQSPLFQRMMMLLHCPYPVESRTPRVWSWTSRFAVILASVAAACLVIRWPQSSHALPAPSAADGARVRFQAPQFMTEPILDTDGKWRSRVYVLPVTLPPRFDLATDVRCDAEGLVRIHVAGHPVDIPGTRTTDAGVINAEPAGSPGPVSEGWHHLHLHRDHRTYSLTIDGRIAIDSALADPRNNWLTIEPSSASRAEFRDLVVSW